MSARIAAAPDGRDARYLRPDGADRGRRAKDGELYAIRVGPVVSSLSGILVAQSLTEARAMVDLLGADEEDATSWTWRVVAAGGLQGFLGSESSEIARSTSLPRSSGWTVLRQRTDDNALIGTVSRDLQAIEEWARKERMADPEVELEYLQLGSGCTSVASLMSLADS